MQHSGCHGLPNIIGGSDLEVHQGERSKEMDDWFREALEVWQKYKICFYIDIFFCYSTFTSQFQLLMTWRKEAFRKHCGKRRKCWLPTVSPFPIVFSNTFVPGVF